jgi:ribosome biogenesis GTPase A
MADSKLGDGSVKEIQWYPGHMAKAARELKKYVSAADVIIEVTDARVPSASRNPDLDKIAPSKPRVIVLNKSDLADEALNIEWLDYYGGLGLTARLNDAGGCGIKAIAKAAAAANREKIARQTAKGRLDTPTRAIVAGIPNAGKSTIINRLAGRAAAETGGKPGVTKGRQWVKAAEGLELLDTPGVLQPKFEERAVGVRLAVTGAINDDILEREELALFLLDYVSREYPGALNRYGDNPGEVTLLSVGKARGCLLKGGAVDERRAANIVIEDFRKGRLGRVSLERAGF